MLDLRDTIVDNELIEKIKLGEKWAINQLYYKYKSQIINYLISRGNNRETCKDCYQESMVIMIQKIEEGALDDNEGSVLPYIRNVAKIVSLRKHRANRNTRSTEIDEEKMSDPVKSIEEERIDQEQKCRDQKALSLALKSLNSICRRIIELSFFYEPPFSASEIADFLDYASANTLRVTKSRCLSNLREDFHQRIQS